MTRAHLAMGLALRLAHVVGPTVTWWGRSWPIVGGRVECDDGPLDVSAWQ